MPSCTAGPGAVDTSVARGLLLNAEENAEEKLTAKAAVPALQEKLDMGVQNLRAGGAARIRGEGIGRRGDLVVVALHYTTQGLLHAGFIIDEPDRHACSLYSCSWLGSRLKNRTPNGSLSRNVLRVTYV